MKNEKFYKIFYGENTSDYVVRSLPLDDIKTGFLTENKAFDVFFSDMILCNDYFKVVSFEDVDMLTENNEDVEEYQLFIVDLVYSEDVTIKVVEKMGNTLYFDNKLGLYILGVTDFGMSRHLINTNLKVKE